MRIQQALTLILERRATNVNRHCERSAAIQQHQSLDCRASLAMTGGADLTQDTLSRRKVRFLENYMTVEIRKGCLDDATVIALLGRLTFRETFADVFVEHESELQAYLDSTFSVAKIASSIGKPENQYWLALLDGLPIGYAKQKYPSNNALIDSPASAQLQKIYVLSEFQKHRIGHTLLDTIVGAARAADARVMWLSVLETNERAISFYQRHGWTSAGVESFSIGTQIFSYLVCKIAIGE
jgi:diamine N-acetyltransferase